MPPKRKRTGAHPPPPRPEAPRRSSKRLKEQPVVDEARDSSHMGIDWVKGDQHKGLLEEKMGKKEDVQKTMRELSELEHKLQSEAMRHRLDVETSDLHVEPDSPSQLALKPRAHLPRRDTDLVSFQNPETKLRSQEQTEILPCKVLSQHLDTSLESDACGVVGLRNPMVKPRLNRVWMYLVVRLAHDKDDLDTTVASVMEWLARPDNGDWLLIFDNFDQDHEQGGVQSKLLRGSACRARRLHRRT
ncbi:hypothetical protein B0J13DRAFT_614056 [Dactylonectria estremocensis]|uniref:Uncharacterized protein n=1 Tax=Dactylonectria estremocensis TaxID=1079267 RepID=A0A9P9D3Z4_9HYPO|nr:hypothetical protein B0J13DRAFT_614056 [Dactylonectria estremocensis]